MASPPEACAECDGIEFERDDDGLFVCAECGARYKETGDPFGMG